MTVNLIHDLLIEITKLFVDVPRWIFAHPSIDFGRIFHRGYVRTAKFFTAATNLQIDRQVYKHAKHFIYLASHNLVCRVNCDAIDFAFNSYLFSIDVREECELRALSQVFLRMFLCEPTYPTVSLLVARVSLETTTKNAPNYW